MEAVPTLLDAKMYIFKCVAAKGAMIMERRMYYSKERVGRSIEK